MSIYDRVHPEATTDYTYDEAVEYWRLAHGIRDEMGSELEEDFSEDSILLWPFWVGGSENLVANALRREYYGTSDTYTEGWE